MIENWKFFQFERDFTFILLLLLFLFKCCGGCWALHAPIATVCCRACIFHIVLFFYFVCVLLAHIFRLVAINRARIPVQQTYRAAAPLPLRMHVFFVFQCTANCLSTACRSRFQALIFTPFRPVN